MPDLLRHLLQTGKRLIGEAVRTTEIITTNPDGYQQQQNFSTTSIYPGQYHNLPVSRYQAIEQQPIIDPTVNISSSSNTMEYLGRQLPDFSVCGCNEQLMAHQQIADSQIITLHPAPNPLVTDRYQDIQEAIENLESRQPDKNGFRGLILIESGDYLIASDKPILIRQSGIIIRGHKTLGIRTAAAATRFLCSSRTGSTLFQIKGDSRRLAEYLKDPPESKKRIRIVADIPAGSCHVRLAETISLTNNQLFKVGDTIRVVRIGNQHWIDRLGMSEIPKRPNAPPDATKNWQPFNLHYDRVIEAVDIETNTIRLNAAIMTGVEERFGGGYVFKYDDETFARITKVGIENITAICLLSRQSPQWKDYNLCKSSRGSDSLSEAEEIRVRQQYKYCRDSIQICEEEQHVDKMIEFDCCRDCWGLGLDSQYFGRHTVIGPTALNVSVVNCNYLVPAAKIEGTKRYGFTILGQLSLVQYCTTFQARHAFAVDARVCGPNVFHRCRAIHSMGASETHHRWGNGILFDNIHGDVSIQNRQWMGSGQGHSGANCVVWNCNGHVTVQSPPTAWNIAVGKRGRMLCGKYAFPSGDDGKGMFFVDDFGRQDVQPASLFEYQRDQRRLNVKI